MNIVLFVQKELIIRPEKHIPQRISIIGYVKSV